MEEKDEKRFTAQIHKTAFSSGHVAQEKNYSCEIHPISQSHMSQEGIKMKKTPFSITGLVIVSLLAGCGGSPPASYIPPQQISEPILSELIPTFEQQTERVNNCDGANPTYIVTYKTIEAQNATFEVIVGAGGLISGTPIPQTLEIQLEAKIAASLSKQHGVTVEKNHEIFLENTPGKYVEHVITWNVTRVKGMIDVLYGDGTAQVAFTKISNVELRDRRSNEISCDVNTVEVPPLGNLTLTEEVTSTNPVEIATTPPPTQRQQSNSEVSSQLNSIFGVNNWFCFPDRSDAVGVRISNEARIESPIVKVDTSNGSLTSGRIPYGGGATVWLNTFVPTDECPSNQLSSISAWRTARSSDSVPFDKARINSLFGAGNWKCTPNFPYAVTVVNLPAGTLIQYPFTSIDNSSGKYGVGDTMPQSGGATVWLAGSVPQGDCP